jgi:hypothetical protein
MRSYKHIRQHLWRWTSLFVLTIATRNPSFFHWSLLWAIRNKESSSSSSSSNQEKTGMFLPTLLAEVIEKLQKDKLDGCDEKI